MGQKCPAASWTIVGAFVEPFPALHFKKSRRRTVYRTCVDKCPGPQAILVERVIGCFHRCFWGSISWRFCCKAIDTAPRQVGMVEDCWRLLVPEIEAVPCVAQGLRLPRLFSGLQEPSISFENIARR